MEHRLECALLHSYFPGFDVLIVLVNPQWRVMCYELTSCALLLLVAGDVLDKI